MDGQTTQKHSAFRCLLVKVTPQTVLNFLRYKMYSYSLLLLVSIILGVCSLQSVKCFQNLQCNDVFLC